MKSPVGWVCVAVIPFTCLPRVLSSRWGLAQGSYRNRVFIPSPRVQSKRDDFWQNIRGGSTKHEDDNDEERYSRQVYTLGALAHGRVRSSTVYVDGPSESGLLYECVKNLALSGVGRIVVVSSCEENDALYYNRQLDDLGKTYSRAAREEVGISTDIPESDESVVVEFIRCLNPSVRALKLDRSNLSEGDNEPGIILCIDRPYDTQVMLNEIARERGLSYVSVETAGVYGRIFCDFGPKFHIDDVDGETPLVIPLDHVELIDEGNNEFIVHCVDDESHDISKGDKIRFVTSSGETLTASCCAKDVQSPQRFSAVLNSDEHDVQEFVSKLNEEVVLFSRAKIPVEVTFLPLAESTARAKIDGSIFTPSDIGKSFDEIRREAIFECFQTLQNFVKSKARLPAMDDFDEFMTSLRSTVQNHASAAFEEHCRLFTRVCAAKFTPLQCIFGAIAAQETLKAATGLYNPIAQFLLYDCDEILDSSNEDMEAIEGSCSYSGQAYVIGQELVDKMQSKRCFVVGAGAIGCEILKNLAAMGAGTAKMGCCILTDMDTIERSNLSRQLLFRDKDIGNFKSMAAKEALHRLNPLLKMEVHTSKVGDSTDGPFQDRFWSKGIDLVLNALDNVEARLYIDQQCVAYEKALVDAGTLGAKGNVQVVVPHQSESYGSSSDPPETAIPVCTLKNFPYLISHTIQWGRDLFDGLFSRRPKQWNDFADVLATKDVEEIASKVLREQGDDFALTLAMELTQDGAALSGEADSLREGAVNWAVDIAYWHFFDTINQLLKQHPVDSLDEDGARFWSGSRKVPQALSFSESVDPGSRQESINESLIEFVKTAARLRLEACLSDVGENAEISREEAEAALRRKMSPDFDAQADSSGTDTHGLLCRGLQQVLFGTKTTLNLAQFEKDDDSNGHVAFITAASNLRAMCYGIPPADAMETRRVAGKIIPAMITTTAFVSALSCLEMLKLIKGVSLDRHRNAFINLALPFFAFTPPLPAEERQGLQGQVYTLWDRIVIKEGKKAAASGGIRLRQFLKRLKRRVCDDPQEVVISTVTYGEFLVYANFLHHGDEEIMDKKLWDLVEEAVSSAQEFDHEFSREGTQESTESSPSVWLSSFLDFTVVVEDLSSGEEVELPPIRIVRSNI